MTPAVVAIVGVALTPVGELGGNFECYDTRQLQAALNKQGLSPGQTGENNNGERVTLWTSLRGKFLISMTFPGLPATCVVGYGEWLR